MFLVAETQNQVTCGVFFFIEVNGITKTIGFTLICRGSQPKPQSWCKPVVLLSHYRYHLVPFHCCDPHIVSTFCQKRDYLIHIIDRAGCPFWNNRLLVSLAEWKKMVMSPRAWTWSILHFTHTFIIKSSSIKHKKGNIWDIKCTFETIVQICFSLHRQWYYIQYASKPNLCPSRLTRAMDNRWGPAGRWTGSCHSSCFQFGPKCIAEQ